MMSRLCVLLALRVALNGRIDPERSAKSHAVQARNATKLFSYPERNQVDKKVCGTLRAIAPATCLAILALP